MKLVTTAFVTTLLLSTPSYAGDVQVQISAPLGANAYGQLVLGSPSYARPVYVEPMVVYAPYSHQQHWSAWCGHYQACGQPVRFVEVREARPVVVYRAHEGHHKHKHKHEHKHRH